MLDTTYDQTECPPWISDSLIDATIKTFSQNSKPPLDEAEAVELVLTVGQLLEATGQLNLEIDHEDEKVHGMGTSE